MAGIGSLDSLKANTNGLLVDLDIESVAIDGEDGITFRNGGRLGRAELELARGDERHEERQLEHG